MKCPKCKSNLTSIGSVDRAYTTGESCSGRYLDCGSFEPDKIISLSDGADTLDGMDTCSCCGEVVG